MSEALEAKKDAARRELLRWAASHCRDYAWRQAGVSPYEVLVAELLLKRTTATAAGRIYLNFLKEFPSLPSLASAREELLAAALTRIGLQRQRTKATKALAAHLEEQEEGEIPSDLSRLLSVPGLGEYSARAILSFGFGQPVAVVDSNVERVLGRVFQNALPPRPTRGAFQELADQLLPVESHREYNLGLLDLGALVCRYVDPLCRECPLNSICDYYGRGQQGEIAEERASYAAGPGSKLRGMRKGKAIALAKLAQLSGVSKLTIMRIEAGKSSPRPETLRKLAGALQVDPGDL